MARTAPKTRATKTTTPKKASAPARTTRATKKIAKTPAKTPAKEKKSAAKTTAKSNTKTLAKKANPVKKPGKAVRSQAKAGSKKLDLGLLLDCTSSMSSWIERAKTTLKDIISNVISSCDGDLDVQICFVGYRDHCDSERFAIKNFSSDVDDVKKFISGVRAIGGGDFPEDVVGGLRKCLD